MASTALAALAALLVTTPGSAAAAPRFASDGYGSSIAAARNADGRLELFGTDSTGGVWHRRQVSPGAGWTGWEKFDGSLTQVAAQTNADGRVELFGVDRTGGVWHRWQTYAGGGWTGWDKFDGALRP
ncbi:hypothetical protein J7W19_31150 [Streptomyces mobaraensis NBRC 13819 = DSM 40847]|uniref:Peptidoglycan binding protein n=1 Tax=Streptomyces mobaraensis (strain ATCC 29032 / DSM 40847 / JCM 4168 / NBRC 13819 / NCIMB 11159 / IPCR 16-22) TaxID=1223523 RepID=M3BNV8_STRM1|nr:tectonin domain-containing protein [Streptomyces mobaraensis]EMF01335.1 peptidoglycan binding protein [Streptomyces mobaraensis NBRC 13819 = DSM 40847]QTT77251.1 hypothetical protein J7W19_31150 [Streptomyces mobaraensis NBRC 13819 = DSM 40847]